MAGAARTRREFIMNAKVHYPTLPGNWWLKRPSYLRYMLRELTCIAIGAFAILLVFALLRLGQGAEAWQAFRAALATPLAIAWQLVALVFALYHSVTWFALAPRTMLLQIGTRRVPAGWIAGAHYLSWVVLSAIVLVLSGA
ncbi:MAG: fumarate reductase subunit C [Lysobacterales bacterium CG17_big_fil_post_rev_8_21_14_2_50_64_11]|nr:MAG: fumarate reductase subunit C [Xanthomonadales bacterium CG17_big_fil_post_rev_8_21_14_2_50_64_11]PIX60737.1 MAG: fumarate reductase subunit C [Xanthomonadales bacterium CG_4_10_14_3_um_filter_64_11]